jgi:hypothetical protein
MPIQALYIWRPFTSAWQAFWSSNVIDKKELRMPEPESNKSTSLVLNSSTYDMLKFVAQIGLPGVGALYFALSQIWGLPAGEEVVGTITAVDVFLGLFLSASSRQYNTDKEGPQIGFLDVEEADDGTQMMLNFPGDPMEIVNHDKVTFKVRKDQ